MSTLEESDKIDLVDYIQIILKHKYIILIATLLISVIGVLSNQTPTVYKTETLIMLSLQIEEESEINLNVPELSVQIYEILATTPEMSKSLQDTLSTLWAESPQLLTAGYGLNAKIMPEFASTTSPILVLSVTSQNPEVPVKVAQIWSQLFVSRHRGLSSGVAQSYYDWVILQHDTAIQNLEDIEVDLEVIQAKYNAFGIAESELMLKSSKLEQALGTYQAMEVELESLYSEQKHLQELLEPLEENNVWIGFLPLEHLSKLSNQNSQFQTDLVHLMRTLAKITQDSLTTTFQHQIEMLEFESWFKKEITAFQINSEINHITNRLENLNTEFNLYQQEQIDLEQKLKNAKIKHSVYEKHIQTASPVILLGKAISDQALWDRSNKNGYLSKQSQQDLAQYKLYDEHINPDYQQIFSEATQIKIEIDLYTSRQVFLAQEIPSLQTKIITTQNHLDSLNVEAFKLKELLNQQRSSLNEKHKRQISPLKINLQHLREIYEQDRMLYITRKQRLKSLHIDIRNLESDIHFQRLQFSQWRNSLGTLKTIADSLNFSRNRLLRKKDALQNTVEHFSKQLEEARISLKQAEGDVQIISNAAQIITIQPQTRFLLFVGIGFLCSIFLAFLLEFINKARNRLLESKTL